MNSTTYPLDHLLCEVAALPFASERAFHSGIHDLSRSSISRLWAAVESEILSQFPAFSIEEAVAIRDSIWHDGSIEADDRQSLGRYLSRLAKGLFLREEGAIARPLNSLHATLAQREAIARRTWRWLTLSLPPDLILGGLDNASEVDVLSPGIRSMLWDSGFAEVHVHMGATMEFGSLWDGLLSTLHKLKPADLYGVGAPFGGGDRFAYWLIVAATVRTWVVEFLDSSPSQPQWFQDFVRKKVESAQSAAAIGLVVGPLIWEGLEAFATGTLPARHDDDIRWPAWKDLLRWSKCSPLGDRTEGQPIESRLVRQVRRRESDQYLGAMFWQVQRVRTLFYRSIVVRPKTPGLQWFIRFYDRMRSYRKAFPEDRKCDAEFLKSTLRTSGWDEGLRSLEVRTTPPKNQGELGALVQSLDNLRQDPLLQKRPVEVGLVLHFIKHRGHDWISGQPKPLWQNTNADPRGQVWRYCDFYADQFKRVEVLARILCQRPAAGLLIRGADVCTDELGVPAWVMLPLLRAVRHAADCAFLAARRDFGIRIPSLRMTVHAGEDFVHLSSGIRHIDEYLTNLPFVGGDRVGHGLALGVNPELWCRHHPRVAMRREDRFFDLLWELDLYLQGSATAPNGRISTISTEISRLGKDIFQRSRPIEKWRDLYRDLHDSAKLADLGYAKPSIPRAAGVLGRYLQDPDVFQRSKEVVWVETGHEEAALAETQRVIRRRLSALGVAVEVNPTSNLLVGNLLDLAEHPLWRLRPVKADPNLPPLSICIGSDDPTLLASTLPLEYQLLFDTMILSGQSDEEARQWLDRTRQASLEARFTLDPKLIADALEALGARGIEGVAEVRFEERYLGNAPRPE